MNEVGAWKDGLRQSKVFHPFCGDGATFGYGYKGTRSLELYGVFCRSLICWETLARVYM